MITLNNKTYEIPDTLQPKKNPLSSEYIVDWNKLSMYAYLSVDFSRDYCDCLNWWAICRYNRLLTPETLNEFHKYIRWDIAVKYQKIPENLWERFPDKIDVTSMISYQNVSNEFITQHKDEINWVDVPINKITSTSHIWEYVKTIPSLVLNIYKICGAYQPAT